jgi:hypothetical protein
MQKINTLLFFFPPFFWWFLLVWLLCLRWKHWMFNLNSSLLFILIYLSLSVKFLFIIQVPAQFLPQLQLSTKIFSQDKYDKTHLQCSGDNMCGLVAFPVLWSWIVAVFPLNMSCNHNMLANSSKTMIMHFVCFPQIHASRCSMNIFETKMLDLLITYQK